MEKPPTLNMRNKFYYTQCKYTGEWLCKKGGPFNESTHTDHSTYGIGQTKEEAKEDYIAMRG